MSQANGYQGWVIFYKEPGEHPSSKPFAITGYSPEEFKEFSDSIVLAAIEVDVAFDDSTEAEIEALQKTIEQERTRSLRRVHALKERIQDLRSLPAPPTQPTEAEIA